MPTPIQTVSLCPPPCPPCGCRPRKNCRKFYTQCRRSLTPCAHQLSKLKFDFGLGFGLCPPKPARGVLPNPLAKFRGLLQREGVNGKEGREGVGNKRRKGRNSAVPKIPQNNPSVQRRVRISLETINGRPGLRMAVRRRPNSVVVVHGKTFRKISHRTSAKFNAVCAQ